MNEHITEHLLSALKEPATPVETVNETTSANGYQYGIVAAEHTNGVVTTPEKGEAY